MKLYNKIAHNFLIFFNCELHLKTKTKEVLYASCFFLRHNENGKYKSTVVIQFETKFICFAAVPLLVKSKREVFVALCQSSSCCCVPGWRQLKF